MQKVKKEAWREVEELSEKTWMRPKKDNTSGEGTGPHDIAGRGLHADCSEGGDSLLAESWSRGMSKDWDM